MTDLLIKQLLGKKLKKLRKCKKITQEQLGKLLNVDQKRISEWENGKHLINVLTLLKICDIFDVELCCFDLRSNNIKNEK